MGWISIGTILIVSLVLSKTKAFSGASIKPRVAHVTLVPGLNPDVRGELILEQEDPSEPVIIRGTIYGLIDGNHGFHVHEYGELSNNCLDAGGHYNPTHDVHGGLRDLRKHVGDFGNLKSTKGEAEVYVEAHQISLFEGPTSVLEKAVVVHVGEDDLGRGRNKASLLTGNAGGRAGCGRIELEGAVPHQFHKEGSSVHASRGRPHFEEKPLAPGLVRGQERSSGATGAESGGKQHIFEVGKRYEYSFQSWMTTGIPEIAPQYAGFSIKGILAVEPVDDSTVAFTLTDIEAKSFNTKTEGSVDPDMGESMEVEGQSLLQQTVTASFVGGKVVGITSSGEKETAWVTNIHKSIASQLQFQWSSEKDREEQSWIVKASAMMEENAVYNVREETVTGDCEVWYEVSKIPSERIETDPLMLKLKSACTATSGAFEIVKTRNFDKCKKTANFNIMAPVGLNCKPSSSGCDTTAQRTSNTRILACGPMTSQSGLTVQRITTVEKISIDPYGHDTEGLEGSTFLRLELNSVKAATGLHARPKSTRLRGEPNIKSLVYSYFPGDIGTEKFALPQPSLHESEFSIIFKSMNLGQKVQPMLESIVSDLQSSEFESSPASKFISDRMGGLRRIISYMAYEELQKSILGVWASTKEGSVSRQMLIDALMSSGSNPSVVLTLELISSGKLSGERALQAVSMWPLVVRTPTKELFGLMMKSLTSFTDEKLKQTAALSITQLTHHACVSKGIKKSRFPVESMGDFCKPDEPFILEQLLPWLKSQLDSAESTGAKVAYFGALNNLGHEGVVPVVAPYIEDCSSRETRHRRSGELDFSQYKHGNPEEEELEALRAWKKIIMPESERSNEKDTEKSNLLKQMQKLINKYEEELEDENPKVKIQKLINKYEEDLEDEKQKVMTKTVEKKKIKEVEVKKSEGAPSKMNKNMLKAVIEMLDAESDEDVAAAQKKLLKTIGKEAPESSEVSPKKIIKMSEKASEKASEKMSEKASEKVSASEPTENSIPKLRKKIMKVVSLLIDAETEEDLQKAKSKLEKLVVKATDSTQDTDTEEPDSEDEDEEKEEEKKEKPSKISSKDLKLKNKILEAQKEYDREIEEMEQKQKLEDARAKLEAKKAKLQSKRTTRMIHGKHSLFDDRGCRILRSKAVFALSKLAYSHNKRVLPILKSLFFNTAEDYQVRLASLTLLMASNPPLGIWERIAVGTWFDPHPDVVSFFYSSLQSLVTSTNPNLKNSRVRAASVLHLAKPASPSPTSSWNMLSGQFSEKDLLGYVLQMSSFGSATSYMPDNYYTRFTMQMGSGSNTVFELSKYGKQMEKFADVIMLQLVKAGITEPEILSKASSALESIHRQLNIEERAAGMPESHVYISLMESIQRLVTIDQESVTKIVEAIIKSEFSGGIPISLYKWLPLVDATSIIPSESGIAFTFNSHSRVVASVRGSVKGNLIEKNIEAKIFPTATLKLYSQLAVDIPFSSKIVATGVDTHVSFAMPGVFTTGLSKASKTLSFSYEPISTSKDLISLTHLHVRPFTICTEKTGYYLPMSVSQDLAMVSTDQDPESHSIDYEDVFGFRYKIKSSKDVGASFRSAGPNDPMSSLLLSWVPSTLRMREYSAMMDVKASQPKQIDLVVNCGKVTKRAQGESKLASRKTGSDKKEASRFESHWGPITEDMERHTEDILRDVSEGEAMLASVSLHPTHKSAYLSKKKHSLSFGMGSSASRRKHMVSLRGTSGESAMICVDGAFNYPHVSAVRREGFYESDLKTSWFLNVGFGSTCKDRTVEITGYGDRSREGQKLHMKSRKFTECTRRERIGQGISEECSQLRREATALDTYVMDIKYDNIPPYYINRSMGFDDQIRMSMSRYASHNQLDVKNPKGQVHVEMDLIPHTRLANLKVFRPNSNTFYTGIDVPTYLQSVVPLNARVAPALTLMHPQGSPVCLIDRNHITTFDKVSYNASLSSCNHVLAKDCSGRNKIAVLGRKESNFKIVTILASTETIEMNPSLNKVIVNDEPIRLSTTPLNLETEAGQLFARIYKTEDEFMIAELPSHGITVKMNPTEIAILPSVVHKGRTCGICGSNDNLQAGDLRGPTGCSLSSGELLVEAYKLEKPIGISQKEAHLECGQVNRQLLQQLKHEESACHEMDVARYQPGVIRTRISELASAQKFRGKSRGCEKIMRTRMEEREGLTCFSIDPAPACKPGCKPIGLVQQRLAFTCMEAGAKVDRYVAEHSYHPLQYFAESRPSFNMAVSAPIDCRPE